MLNSILEMVTKAKRVMFVLQQKDTHLRRLIETFDLDWRRKHANLVAQTEIRVSEVRRKAGTRWRTAVAHTRHLRLVEEVMLEVRRQSIIDLQKAVAQSEQKSNEILLREREQYQRLNQELKSQTFEEVYAALNRQEDGPEVSRFTLKPNVSPRFCSTAGTADERLWRHVRAATWRDTAVSTASIAIGTSTKSYAAWISNADSPITRSCIDVRTPSSIRTLLLVIKKRPRRPVLPERTVIQQRHQMWQSRPQRRRRL